MPPAAPVPETNRVSAAAARQRSAATATCPVTWTVASLTPAVSLQTAWRSVWSAAASASPPEDPAAAAGGKVDACFPLPQAQEQFRPGPKAEKLYTHPHHCCLGSVAHTIGWSSWLHNTSNTFYRVSQVKCWQQSLVNSSFLYWSNDGMVASPALSFVVRPFLHSWVYVQSEFQLWSMWGCQPVQPLDPHWTSYYYNGAPCAIWMTRVL